MFSERVFPFFIKLLSFCFLQVSFEKSMGPYNILHQLRERHCLKLNSEPEESWLEKAVQKLSNRIADQMRKFPVKNKSMLGEYCPNIV